jgi:pre-rRNA-processing protein IPI1
MTKSHKKKKTKVADFQKTKLKVGKGKAPRENETDTNFSARSLTVLGQYSHSNEDADDKSSERPIKQLFTNLRNGSQYVRAAALSGLKDAIALSPVGGSKYLGNWAQFLRNLQKVCYLDFSKC